MENRKLKIKIGPVLQPTRVRMQTQLTETESSQKHLRTIILQTQGTHTYCNPATIATNWSLRANGAFCRPFKSE